MKSIAFILLLLVIAGCDSKETTYEAFERVKEAKDSGKEIFVSSDDSTETIITIKKPLSEWQKYKNETYETINNATLNINELKHRKIDPNYRDKFNKQVEKLEKKNNQLKIQLIEYQKEREARWQAFKLDMQHQSDEIKTEITFLKQSKGSQDNYLEKLFK